MTSSYKLYEAGQMITTAAATVSVQSPSARFSLRVREENVAGIGEAIGGTLPQKIGQSVELGAARIACLGPDEWLARLPEESAASFKASCDGIYDACPHSLVDVSDREIAIEISGDQAVELLSIGCPRDLRGFAVGEARRTLFGGNTITLWRLDDNCFVIEVWRSFAPHLIDMLKIGCRELSAA